MLCFTDDYWAHTKTALGKITYLNPVTKEYETNYGLIADTIIGTLMMSEKLCISDKNGSVYIDGNGITLDGGKITWKTPIAQIAVSGLTTDLSQINKTLTQIQNFNSTVQTALTGSATTAIGSDYIISPKIGGGYLYLVDGKNSITLNPHTGTVTDGTHTSSTNMFEIVSNDSTIVKVDKSGNLTVTGEINATSGSFTGGVILDGGYLTTNANRTSYDASVSGLTLDKNGIGGYYSTTQYFNMTRQGKLTAVGADITGKINATSGSFTGTVNATSGSFKGGLIQIETSDKSSDYIIFNYATGSETDNNFTYRTTNLTSKELSIDTERGIIDPDGKFRHYKEITRIDSNGIDYTYNPCEDNEWNYNSEVNSFIHFQYSGVIRFSCDRYVSINSLRCDKIVCNTIECDWTTIASNVTSYSGDLSSYSEVKIIMACGDTVYRYSFYLINSEITSETQQYIEGYDNGSYTGCGSININTSGITVGQCRVGNTNYTGYLTIHVR